MGERTPTVGLMVMLYDKKLYGNMPAVISKVVDAEKGIVDLVAFWAGVRPRTVPTIARISVHYTDDPPAFGERPKNSVWGYLEDVPEPPAEEEEEPPAPAEEEGEGEGEGTEEEPPSDSEGAAEE